MGAGNEREYERTASTVFPKGHGLRYHIEKDHQENPRRIQRTTEKDNQLFHAERKFQCPCCIRSLNLSSKYSMQPLISLYRKEITLPEPLPLSGGKILETSTVFLIILEKDGVMAFGEASPMPDGLVYKIGYGNPSDMVERDLIYICENLKLDIIDIDLLKYLHEEFAHVASEALACFDMVIHDYLSKQLKIPIYKMYPDSGSIGDSFMVRTFSSQKGLETGSELKAVKIKVTEKNWDKLDLKSLADAHAYVICDFNRMYKDASLFEEAYVNIVKERGNILFEEPCSLGRLGDEIINEEFSDRIIVDDSFCDKEQIRNPVFLRNPYGINLKIQKIGGIYPCIEIARRISGRRIMVGCNLETSLGVSAGAHLAEILRQLGPNIILTDLDSDILLGLDSGSPSVSPSGRIPKKSAGLGYVPRIGSYQFVRKFIPVEEIRSVSTDLARHHDKDYIYNRIADRYCNILRSPGCHANIIPNALRMYHEYSISSGSILDVGCGPGNLKDFLAGGFSFSGIDISKKMLSLAKRKGYEVIFGDMLQELKKIPDKSFDHVVAFSSLQFIGDVDMAIREIGRVAKKSWLISLDQITPKLIELYNKNEGIHLYDHFDKKVENISEEIYFSGWKSPTTNEVIKCRLIFKKIGS